jgi:hypothetical protein
MSLGGSQTTTQQIDPEIKSRLLSAYDQANSSAGSLMPAYTGPRVAGLNNIESDAIGNLGQSATVGWTPLDQAINATNGQLGNLAPQQVNAMSVNRTPIDAAGGAPTISPMSVNRTPIDAAGGAPTMPLIQAQATTGTAPSSSLFSYRDVNAPAVGAAQIAPTQGAQAYGAQASLLGALPSMSAAQVNPGSVGQVGSQSFPGSNLGGYMNPFTSDVYNTSLNQLDVARQRALAGNTDTANIQGGEGAWNGARAGVADSLTNEAFGRQAADLASNLNQQNFNTAAGLQQSDAARALTAAMANQQTGLNLGSTNAGLQQQAGMTNVDSALQGLLQNSALGTDVSKFNAGNLTGASQFNAGNDLTRAMQQAQFGQQAGLANASNALTAGQANQGADLSRAGTLYGGNLTQGLTNQADLNNMALSNAQLGQNAWQFNGDLLNNRQMFDVNNANQIGLANADQNLQAQEYNSGLLNNRQMFDVNNANTIGAANADRNLQAQQLNQAAQLASTGQAFTGAGLLGSLAGQAQNQWLTGQNAALNAGMTAQAQNQANVNAQMQQYQDQQNYPFLQAQLRQMGLGALGGATGGTSSTQQSPGILGMLGTALMGASLFSDRRLKTDVRPVGVRNGRNWYAWRYVWDHPSVTRIGVMAQENPDIASEHESGWLQVDYERIAA